MIKHYRLDKNKYDKWLKEGITTKKELYYVFLSTKSIRNEILEEIKIKEEKQALIEKQKIKSDIEKTILKKAKIEEAKREFEKFKRNSLVCNTDNKEVIK